MNTTNRPTPEQIHQAIEDEHDGGFTSSATISEYVNALAEHGYVIVHPDDVPVQTTAEAAWGPAWGEGWNACRAHIFKETTSE